MCDEILTVLCRPVKHGVRFLKLLHMLWSVVLGNHTS